MKYTSHTLKNDLTVNKLYTVHYFEFSKNYIFPGEAHNFWEFMYIDKGRIICSVDNKEVTIEQGNVIFFKPEEWHSMRSDGKTASNAVVVSFECKSALMDFFEGKILKTGREQRRLISKIISEYTNAFSTPLDAVYSNRLQLKANPAICSQQLIRQYICEFLILFLRESCREDSATSISINHSHAMLNILINYMSENLHRSLTIDEMARYSGTNRACVNRIFKSHLDCPPIKYFLLMKMTLAKKYLREDNYNISQIAELLGYNSIHYFSTQFKTLTGMSPSEYAASIKAISASALSGTDIKK